MFGKKIEGTIFKHLPPTSSGDFLAIGYSDPLDLPGYPADTVYAVKLDFEGKILRKERIPRVYDPIPVTDGYIALGYTSDADVCLVKDCEF